MFYDNQTASNVIMNKLIHRISPMAVMAERTASRDVFEIRCIWRKQ